MKLLIGKNSSIVNSISKLLDNDVHIISHSEIHCYDLNNYDEIWIFSWDHKNYNSNVKLINKLPLSKCVFISSTAVHSLALRRQWNNYPNWKSQIEKLVIAANGRVVRLGVINRNLLLKSFGYLPVTSLNDIANLINLGFSNLSNNITIAASVESGDLKGFQLFLSIFLYRLSFYLPYNRYIQGALDFIQKYMIGSKSYGYTADSCLFFCNVSLIGFGVLGSTSFKELHKANYGISTIIVSPDENSLICEPGFLGSRIGKFKNGLAAFWHGVSIISRNGIDFKRVPLFIKRNIPPKYSIKANVISIEENLNFLDLNLASDAVDGLIVRAKKVVLAAGPIENARILQHLAKLDCTFSDHEIGMIGYISKKDNAINSFLGSAFGILYGRRVLILTYNNFKFLLDFRPFCSQKHSYLEQSIYDQTTINIFKKLITRFSFSQINEAFFNKFGFSFSTSKISIFIQIVSEDCIKLDSNGDLSRNRISLSTLETLGDHIRSLFPSFTFNKSVVLRDSQHIVGGSQLLKSHKIENLIKKNKLLILGSPTNYKLGAKHHTSDFIIDVVQLINNFIK